MSAFGVGGNGFSAALATNDQAHTLPSSSIAPPTMNDVGGSTAEDMAELSRLLIMYDNDIGKVQAHLTRESGRVAPPTSNNVGGSTAEDMAELSRLLIMYDNDLGQVQAHLTRESERIQREELQLLASSSFPHNIKVRHSR